MRKRSKDIPKLLLEVDGGLVTLRSERGSLVIPPFFDLESPDLSGAFQIEGNVRSILLEEVAAPVDDEVNEEDRQELPASPGAIGDGPSPVATGEPEATGECTSVVRSSRARHSLLRAETRIGYEGQTLPSNVVELLVEIQDGFASVRRNDTGQCVCQGVLEDDSMQQALLVEVKVQPVYRVTIGGAGLVKKCEHTDWWLNGRRAPSRLSFIYLQRGSLIHSVRPLRLELWDGRIIRVGECPQRAGVVLDAVSIADHAHPSRADPRARSGRRGAARYRRRKSVGAMPLLFSRSFQGQ